MMRQMTIFVLWSSDDLREDVCEMLDLEGHHAVPVTDVEMLDLLRDLYRPDLVIAGTYFQSQYRKIIDEMLRYNIPAIFYSTYYEQVHYFRDEMIAYRHQMRFCLLPFFAKNMIDDIDDLLREKRNDLRWMNRIYQVDEQDLKIIGSA